VGAAPAGARDEGGVPMGAHERGLVRRYGKAVCAALLTMGTLGVAAAASATSRHGSAHSKHPVVLDGHICTKVATAHHNRISGHVSRGRPAVLCGLAGNDTLRATGPGTVILVAGPGHDTLIPSSTPGAHDILVGGAGPDSFGCTPGGTTTVIGDDQGDDESGCDGSDVANASQEWQGTVTAFSPATNPTSLTIQWSDVNDAAQAWLDANSDPSTATFDTTTATIVGNLVVGGEVTVAANPSSTTLAGSTLVAVTVFAGEGDNATCTGTITGSVEGDLQVSAGSCTLNGADVQGDVSVDSGANFTSSNATIEGDLAATGGGAITLTNTNIQGDLNCSGNTSVTDGGGNTVEGDASGQCAGIGGGGGDDDSQ